MFANLSDRLQGTLQKVSGQGTLNEENVKEALREVKLALLEADVNLKIVKEFVDGVRSGCLGVKVEKGLNPARKFVQLVHEKLVEIMGTDPEDLHIVPGRMTRVLMAGLQGSGKTTTCGKLARRFKEHNPLLVACDVYRPAAVEQLKTVAKQVGVVCFEQGTDKDPVEIARSGLTYASENNHGLVIFDTAGRLQIDEELMVEIERIKGVVGPDETLLVLDAMTGQEAVRVSKSFDDRLDLSGVVLSKLDGDARGGAALSLRKTIGKPIKYSGIGEQLDGLELFHPQQMASRILGRGDLLGLAEKAGSVMDEKKAKRLQRRMGSGEFNLVDFLEQIKMIQKMGPMEDLLKMIPGIGKFSDQLQGVGKETQRVAAIIQSMTVQERYDPTVLNASRRRRIAMGSGTTVQQVNQLMKQFEQMKLMMKQFKKKGLLNPARLMGGKGLPFGL